MDVSAHEDPEGEAPWAMQLVVRVERGVETLFDDACAAAATAVVTACERSRVDGWHADDFDRWMAGRIRKHTRRARGAAWERVQALPGVTVEAGSAQVRALVPGPTDEIPRDVAKLQLSGLELPAGSSMPPGRGPTVWVAPQLSAGKAVAAAGHAAQLLWMQDRPAPWRELGWAVSIGADFDAARGVADVTVADAGFTEVDPGTVTAVAAW
jgi:peptidyl-tRNA hydrolase